MKKLLLLETDVIIDRHTIDRCNSLWNCGEPMRNKQRSAWRNSTNRGANQRSTIQRAAVSLPQPQLSASPRPHFLQKIPSVPFHSAQFFPLPFSFPFFILCPSTTKAYHLFDFFTQITG
jgi:hypothetical protein